ncbi:hypothetical protein ACNKHW_07625 [Shigella flexneri]
MIPRRKDGIPLSVIDAAQKSPVYKWQWSGNSPAAAPGNTYSADGLVCTASVHDSVCSDAGCCRTAAVCRMWKACASGSVPRQPATSGDTTPVLRAAEPMLAMRHYKRAETVDVNRISVHWKKWV